MSSTSAYEVGQQVKAVRGSARTMNPERRYVGRVGTVTKLFPPVACCQPYYCVSFGHGQDDYIDHCNLEVLS